VKISDNKIADFQMCHASPYPLSRDVQRRRLSSLITVDSTCRRAVEKIRSVAHLIYNWGLTRPIHSGPDLKGGPVKRLTG